MDATTILGLTNLTLIALVVYLLWYQRVLIERMTNPPKRYLEEQLAKLGRKGHAAAAAAVVGAATQGPGAPNEGYVRTDDSI